MHSNASLGDQKPAPLPVPDCWKGQTEAHVQVEGRPTLLLYTNKII